MSSEVRVLECVSAVFQKSPKLAESRTQGVFLPVASVLDDINDPLVRITAKVAKIKPLLSPHPFGGRTLKKKNAGFREGMVCARACGLCRLPVC